jgi:hypothetical protein
MNTKKILSIYAMICLLIFGSCKKDDFVEIEGVCPVVISTIPTNGATNVPISQLISVTFNEEMNLSTINEATITIKDGSSVQGGITYQGTTATFTPNSPLTPNTTYTGRVTTGVKDITGNALQTDYIWTFSTGALLSPLVILTDPENLESNVNINKVVMATFNMPMDALTINSTTFTIGQGGTNIAGTISYTGATASFAPTELLKPNTTYTGTITSGVKNPSGTSLVSDYVWTFTTGTVMAPMVISTDPSNNAIDVGLNKIVTATFSEPINPSTINSSSFTIRQGTTLILGVVSYTGLIATFTPDQPFLQGSVYTGTISKAVKNIDGISLTEDYIWSFTTLSGSTPIVISTDPQANEIEVPINKTVTATFSEVMNAATINNTTFTLKQGASTIAGVVTYSGITASFNPTNNLLSGTTYTATVTTGAKNGSGTSLANNYIWTFTTGTVMAPTVISTDPSKNATGVSLSKIVTATFSTAMDPTTITGSTFTIKNGTTTVTGVVTYSGTTASFNPSFNLISNTTYTATITTGAKDISGTSLANNYIWSFTTLTTVAPTVTSTDPANNATGVSLSKTVTATFSTAMDPNTINGGTFTIKNGGTAVTGVINYSGTTASFNPSSNLISNTTYTATITTGVKDVSGTPMANNFIWTFTTLTAGPPNVDLGGVARFGIIAGVGVSNNAGFSVINNLDVGISPGVRSSVTGFPPATINNGAIYASDDISPPGVAAMLAMAKNDLVEAYLFAEGATTPAPATISGDLGGLTLAPGIYKTTSTLLIQSGNLTLDAQGNANAVWIFQIASGFTTVGGAGGSIILAGGAKASNIFWQVGSSATIGDFTSFYGNILALTSVTMNSGAVATGRMLCINGAVVMTNTNTINKP